MDQDGVVEKLLDLSTMSFDDLLNQSQTFKSKDPIEDETNRESITNGENEDKENCSSISESIVPEKDVEMESVFDLDEILEEMPNGDDPRPHDRTNEGSELKKQLRKTSLKTIKKYKLILKNRMARNASRGTRSLLNGNGSGSTETQEEDDVRSKLKQQLTLLRTNKKTAPLAPTTDFVFSGERNKKWRDQKVNKEQNSTDNSLENEDEKDPSRPDNETDKSADKMPVDEKESDESVSTNSELVIVSVIGGYRSPEREETGNIAEEIISMEKPEDSDVACIKLTKTNDITKIKGWKDKKFILENETKSSPSSSESNVIVTNEPIADTSTSNKIYLLPLSEFGVKEEVQEPSRSSAFVSDELDQFLTENIDLNISYEVPKLSAEEGVTGTAKMKEYQIPEQDLLIPKGVRGIFKTEQYKAKTLAEKRMMLEKQQIEKYRFILPRVKKTVVFNEQTVPVVRKEINNYQSLLKDNTPFTRFRLQQAWDFRKCYVIYNGKKLRVPALSDKPILEKIYFNAQAHKRKKNYDLLPAKQRKSNNSGKPSLLKSLLSSSNVDVKYSLGPLSKKQIIAPTKSLKRWETVIKQLPRVYLEVSPEIGKPLDSQIVSFFESDKHIILSKEKIDMALSMLPRNEDEAKQTFTFDVPYEYGQQKIILRREIDVPLIKLELPKEIVEPEEEIAKAVNDVMDKMLNYVENFGDASLAVSPSFESETGSDVSKTEDDGLVEGDAADRGIKRKKGVFSKTKLEMKRLNCKLVSIAIETEEEQQQECTKDHCKLGCVCKSLECMPTNLLTNHCGKIDCMFECVCEYDKWQNNQKITLPPGTNLFSAGTINHIQNEAKKDLAKEEKDFTQTVIEANDQLIVVDNLRDRKRRATKVPKKYCDFVEHQDVPAKNKLPGDVSEKATEFKEAIVHFDCAVVLKNHDFSQIVPYCMAHNLYKCHCECQSIENLEPIESKIVLPTQPVNTTAPGVKIIETKRNPRAVYSQQANFFDKEIHCSRTRGITTSYYIVRNKTIVHKKKIEAITKKLKKDLRSFLKDKMCEKDFLENDEFPFDAKGKLCPPSPKSSDANRIFDRIEVRSKELKIQRRKIKPNRTNCDSSESSLNNEISQSSNTTNTLHRECLNLLGNTTSQVRLLPWKKLVSCYNNTTLQVWYCTIGLPKVLLTEDGQRPGKQYCNVRLFEQMKNAPVSIDVVRWLITKSVPVGKNADSIFVILKYNHSFWEICGVCEKNVEQSKLTQDKGMFISLIKDSWSTPSDNNGNNSSSSTSTSSNADFFRKHVGRTYEGVKFPRRSLNRISFMKCLRFECMDETSGYIAKILFAPLPMTRLGSKWRVIQFAENFEYVTFLRNGYSIRAQDITRAGELAQKDMITVYIKSTELKSQYYFSAFGIYCVTNMTRKFFVGPYRIDEEHDLELTYLKDGQEVKTYEGYWFVQKEDDNDQVEVVDDNVIDLTKSENESDVDINNFSLQDRIQKAKDVIDVLLIMNKRSGHTQPLQRRFNSKPRFDTDSEVLIHSIYNPSLPKRIRNQDIENIRFVVTNVPGFGYIPGYEEPNGLFFVSCPLQKAMRSFSSHAQVITTYERELLDWFVMAPLCFRIKVSVLNDIESTSKVLPMDPSIVTGYNIVSQFGVLETSADNSNTLARFGLTKEEVELVLIYRGRKAAQFATSSILNAIQAPLRYPLKEINKNFYYALVLLKEEVALLKNQEEELTKTKSDLQKKKLQLVVTYTDLMRNLSKTDYEKAKSTLNDIIRIKTEANEISNFPDLSMISSLPIPNETEVPITTLNNEVCIEPLMSEDQMCQSYIGRGGWDELEVSVLEGKNRTPKPILRSELIEFIPKLLSDNPEPDEDSQTIDNLPEVDDPQAAENRQAVESPQGVESSPTVDNLRTERNEEIVTNPEGIKCENPGVEDDKTVENSKTVPKMEKPVLIKRPKFLLSKPPFCKKRCFSISRKSVLPTQRFMIPTKVLNKSVTFVSSIPTSTIMRTSANNTGAGILKSLLYPSTSNEMMGTALDGPAELSSSVISRLADQALNNLEKFSGASVSKSRKIIRTTTAAAVTSTTVTTTAVIATVPTTTAAATIAVTSVKSIPTAKIIFNPSGSKTSPSAVSLLTGTVLKPNNVNLSPTNTKKVVNLVSPSGIPISCVLTTNPKSAESSTPKDKAFKPLSISLPKSSVPALKPGFIAVNYKDGTTKYIPCPQRLAFTSSLVQLKTAIAARKNT